jgi:hypothetical protein
MNPFCQIEHGSSDSDVGMPRGKAAAATADLRSALTVNSNVAGIRSALCAMTTA